MENKELESLPKLLRQFCAYLQYERQYAPHTLTAYCKDLQQFGGYMDERYGLLVLAEATALGQLRPLHVRGYIASLEAKRSTLNRKLSAIRSFVKYQHRMGVIESVPTLKMKLPKTPRRVPVAVAQDALAEQLEQMRAVADDFESARNWLILELLYGCGLRRQELIDLQWQQIDPAARIMSVWGKGSKERTVPYNTAVDAALSHYRTFLSLEQQAPSTPVLLTSKGGSIYPKLVYRVVKSVLDAVPGLSKASPHVLRHSFATHLLDNAANLNTVKVLLGHSSLSSTQIYVHASVARLKSVYEQAHPKS